MDKKPYIVAVFMQLIITGNIIVSKAAFNGGMPTTIFVFYRQVFASLCFFPFAIVFGRGKAPKLSLPIFVKIFFLALLGVTFCLNIFNLGVKYSSSTATSAMTNAFPVVTFAISVLLRIESVKPKEATGIAKIVGIVLCLTGVLVLAFYEGPHIKSISQLRPILHGSNTKQLYHSKREWIMGTFILIIFAISWCVWLILQGSLSNQYSSKLMFSTTCNFLGTIQSFFVALLSERNLNKWKLHFDVRLLGVSYTGIFVSGILFYLQVWCIERRGAVFVTVWQPLSLLTTLACSSFFLGETINLGRISYHWPYGPQLYEMIAGSRTNFCCSVLGGLLMVGGLYSVLWGKNKEITAISSNQSKTHQQQVPVVECTTQDQVMDVHDRLKH